MVLVGALLASTALITARAMPPQEPPAGPTDFDFWIGSWECRNPDGSVAGTNTITKILKGRVLEERWSGGGDGRSFNLFDAATGRWHQTWVDDSGTLLLLDGGLDAEGSMVLEGVRPAPPTTPSTPLAPGTERATADTVRHRIRWTPLEGGRVRQHWTSSQDDGETWSTVVDLTYHPQAAEAPDEAADTAGEAR